MSVGADRQTAAVAYAERSIRIGWGQDQDLAEDVLWLAARLVQVEAALREIQNVAVCELDAVEAATIVSHLAAAALGYDDTPDCHEGNLAANIAGGRVGRNDE